MIECKGCGAVLRFDIPKQKLTCDYCKCDYDVEEFDDVRTADSAEPLETESVIEMYEFRCPQCGGEVYGDSHDMTGFCQYCGSPVELSGRLTKIERPQAVIPFKKTKEECKKAFFDMVKGNPYLPKAYKSDKYIDSFRGIYMPYYLYHIDYDGEFETSATGKTYTRGGYQYTDTYKISGKIKGTCSGFEHDSSTVFSDEISEALGPFNTEDRRDFKPGYLSGFYADSSDESDTLYTNTAAKTANSVLKEQIAAAVKKEERSANVRADEKLGSGISNVRAEKAMYPVWFMSYNNKGRVAYAAVNGQTGKVTADLPVDIVKFLIISLITTLPVYLLLNLFAFFVPSTMLKIYSIFSLFCTFLLFCQSGDIMKREKLQIFNLKETPVTEKKPQPLFGSLLVPVFIVVIILVAIFGVLLPKVLNFLVAIPPFLSFAVIVMTVFIILRKLKLAAKGVKLSGVIMSLISAVLIMAAQIINLIKPASDAVYYGGCIVLLVSVVLQLLMLVKNHNFLTTRKPEQFNKKGGDDRA